MDSGHCGNVRRAHHAAERFCKEQEHSWQVRAVFCVRKCGRMYPTICGRVIQFGSPQVANRLDQGPFGIDQDQGWFTIFATQPSRDHIRNFGAGLVGYTWEENGPALGVQCGRETLEQSVEKMASLPFVDVLYIRCDWRDVQTGPGKLSSVPGLGHNIRRCQTPQSGSWIPHPAFQSEYPTAKAFACRIFCKTKSPS